VLTPIIVLETDLEPLLVTLPFTATVPWRKLLTPIKRADWDRGPVTALRKAVWSMEGARWQEVVPLMKKHRADVLWGVEDSRAVRNTLKEAKFLLERAESESSEQN